MRPGGLFSTKYASELAIVKTKTQWFFLAVALVFSIAIIPVIADDYWLSVLARIGITLIVVLGLHILSGLGGLISLGQGGFVLVGAYIVAILTHHWGLNGWLCLPICAIGSGIAGIIFGLPSVRLKMFYLALATLAAHQIIYWCFTYEGSQSVVGPSHGLSLAEHPLTLGSIDFSSEQNMYILVAIMVAIGTFMAVNIQRSNTGRKFIAIRDNELAAEVSGIWVFRNKLLAFFISCAFAGVAGWLWAYAQMHVSPRDYTIDDGIFFMGMILIGGWGSTTGVFLGVFFLEFLDILMSDHISPWLEGMVSDRWGSQLRTVLGPVVGGLGIILFMKYMPKGLVGVWERFKQFYRLHPYSFWGG